MKVEFMLVVFGLLLFSLFAWLRRQERFANDDTQHMVVVCDVGCTVVIIGMSALILRSLTTFN